MQAIAKTSVPTCKSFCPAHLDCGRGTFCFMCVYQEGRWGFSSFLFCCISASYCSVLKINGNYIMISRLKQLPILCYITNPDLFHSAQISSLIVPPRSIIPLYGERALDGSFVLSSTCKIPAVCHSGFLSAALSVVKVRLLSSREGEFLGSSGMLVLRCSTAPILHSRDGI